MTNTEDIFRTTDSLGPSLASMSLSQGRSGNVEHRTGNAESRYSRIKLAAIAPPRTIDSLKRCLCQIENLSDSTNQRTDLYLTASSDSPIQDGARPSAVAFVLRQPLSDAEKPSVGGIHVPDNFRISPGISKADVALVIPPRRRDRGLGSMLQYIGDAHNASVYYRVHTPEKAILSAGAFHPKDEFLGRIEMTRIPPPHTAATLSRCLADAERLGHQYAPPMLFLTAASQTPMSGAEKISILEDGPGSTPERALALVLPGNPWSPFPEALEATVESSIPHTVCNTPSGEFDSAKEALFSVLPSLHPRNHITPPHTAAAIRRCIAKVEGNARLICGVLYPDNSGSMPIPENAWVSLAPNRGALGMSSNTPVVLVEQERRAGVFNRPAQCMVSMDRASNLPGWLFCVRGEVVFTNGVLKETGIDSLGSSRQSEFHLTGRRIHRSHGTQARLCHYFQDRARTELLKFKSIFVVSRAADTPIEAEQADIELE
ncbi:hypothetical protein B0H17DRAFT_1149152 [Mycena rosella]|uniref:Uncharacterized protein n=1 Tax=Mycena rosella TaxID=1033263 RepID=A0AAD7C5Z2_MYCRO|nr:hypothetical protein B0H17DRAFT_1149152 [Mycena rosella]